jgi:hypothetical protein
MHAHDRALPVLLTAAEIETIVSALWIAHEATEIVWPARSAECKMLADRMDGLQ